MTDQSIALASACFYGDIKLVGSIINTPNTTNEDLNLGMINACIGGNVAVANLLYNCGASNIDEPIPKSVSESIDDLRTLKKYGAKTFIDCLIYTRDVKIMNRLMRKHGTKTYNEEFLIACDISDLKTIKLLAKYVTYSANNWNKGLKIACDRGCVKTAKLLIQYSRTYKNIRRNKRKWHGAQSVKF